MPTFPVASADIQHRLSSRSGSGVFLRVCVPESRHIILCKWAMQMSYANARRAISRQFVIFLSRRLFFRDYLFLLLLLLPAACSAVMARPVGKTERSWAVYFIGDGVTAHSANWRSFPALENLMPGRNMSAVCISLIHFFWRRNKNRGWWAAGSAFKRWSRSLPAIVSTLSSLFLNSAVKNPVSQDPRTISTLFIALLLFAHHQTSDIFMSI